MTFAERTAAVAAFGFTERQAAFLTLVALHSGYCLRRQYAAFIGCKYGKNVRDFLDGLVERGIGTRTAFRADRGGVYHLHWRPLYAAIGEENNRNRRHASAPLISRKVMLLDFVIEHAGLDWYATERDKVDLLVNRCQVPPSALPQRTYTPKGPHRTPAADTTRYWIQKLPIFLSPTPPAVNFVCLVADPQAVAAESFVRDHAPLLRHLDGWALHVVTPRSAATETAVRAAYQRALGAASLAPIDEVTWRWFQRTGDCVRRGDLRELAVSDLERYRELSAQLVGATNSHGTGPLVFHAVPHSYTQFGSLAGIA